MEDNARIGQASGDVFTGDSGTVLQDARLAPALGEQIDDEFHGQASSLDNGFSADNLGIDQDAVLVIHELHSSCEGYSSITAGPIPCRRRRPLPLLLSCEANSAAGGVGETQQRFGAGQRLPAFQSCNGRLAGAHARGQFGMREPGALARPVELGGDLELRGERVIFGFDLGIGQKTGLELVEGNGLAISFARRKASSIPERRVIGGPRRLFSYRRQPADPELHPEMSPVASS